MGTRNDNESHTQNNYSYTLHWVALIVVQVSHSLKYGEHVCILKIFCLSKACAYFKSTSALDFLLFRSIILLGDAFYGM